MTAGMNDFQPKAGRLRVATKFVNVTRRFFAEQGQQVEVIKLYGSMELGPIVGLSDLIVDVVDTGNTLKANGLKPIDHIADISSRLVVNKASLKMKHDRIQTMVDQMRKAVQA
jgi:ATP phosphoribosyltransferase